jgi:hypothetical protein
MHLLLVLVFLPFNKARQSTLTLSSERERETLAGQIFPSNAKWISVWLRVLVSFAA